MPTLPAIASAVLEPAANTTPEPRTGALTPAQWRILKELLADELVYRKKMIDNCETRANMAESEGRHAIAHSYRSSVVAYRTRRAELARIAAALTGAAPPAR